MAKLKKKTTNKKMRQQITSTYDNKRIYKRQLEHSVMSMMDDLRIVFAYAAHNRLGYSKKRLERIELLCNKYLMRWRQDEHAETIEYLKIYSKAVEYMDSYHTIGDKLPSSFAWEHINRYMSKQAKRNYDAPTLMFYARNEAKIVILFMICALDELRRQYRDINKDQCREVADAFVLDMLGLGDKSNEVTLDDMKMVLKEECNYVYGLQPGSWHDFSFT